jgi:hypothetical protein
MVHASHRYVLPVVSGLAFFLGGISLVRDPEGLTGLVPFAFFALGSVTLATSLGYALLRITQPAPASVPATPPPAYLPVDEVDLPEADDNVTVSWEDQFYRRFDLPDGLRASSRSARVLFTPTSAADQLWVHWLPAEVGELPVELIPPIAESAFFPSAESSAEAFPLDIATVEPAQMGMQLTIPTVADRVVVRPRVEERTGPFGEIPESTSAHKTPETPAWMRAVLAEALNPIPPHLRQGTDMDSTTIGSTSLEPGRLFDLPRIP